MPFNAQTKSTQETALSALQRTAIFQAMADKEAYGLFAASKKLELDKGSFLYHQEADADWFYLVLSGWVKVFRETLDGDEAVIELVGAGKFVGELAPLEDNVHSCNASVAEKAVVLRLPTSLLNTAVQENHSVALAMLNEMARKRLENMKEVEGLKLQKADQRIGCFILRQCEGKPDGEHALKLPYCKSLIATQLGMKGETFSRALNKLRKSSGIDIAGSQVHVPEILDLSDLVCAGCSNEYPCKDLVQKAQQATN